LLIVLLLVAFFLGVMIWVAMTPPKARPPYAPHRDRDMRRP
jgi:hypothetical protein